METRHCGSRGLSSPALGLPENQHIGGVARVIALRTSLRVSTPSSPASAARGPRRWSRTALAAPPPAPQPCAIVHALASSDAGSSVQPAQNSPCGVGVPYRRRA